MTSARPGCRLTKIPAIVLGTEMLAVRVLLSKPAAVISSCKQPSQTTSWLISEEHLTYRDTFSIAHDNNSSQKNSDSRVRLLLALGSGFRAGLRLH